MIIQIITSILSIPSTPTSGGGSGIGFDANDFDPNDFET